MKILVLHHVADIYGASQSLLRLTSGLVRDGHAVMVVLPEQGPLCAALATRGVGVTVRPDLPVLHRNRLTSPAGVLRLLRDARTFRRGITEVMQSFHPDVIHTNTGAILPVAGAVARRLGIARIQHLRESFLDFGPLWPPYRAWLVRSADRILCISGFVASMFTAAQRSRAVQVIHNGIPREEFEGIDPAEVAAFRARFAGDGPLIGVAGRIKLVRKGQDVFVRAAARIKDRFPSARFVVIGSPFTGNESHLDTLKDMVRELGLEGRVGFAGHLDRPLIGLAALDISVMASVQPEPLGNVTIESMALGRAVIGTRIGGTPELIRDGETGLLVPPGDDTAMADAMARLLADPGEAAAMGRRARTHYENHLAFDTFYRNLVAVYHEVIRR
ncbi:MAG TPA: glycosyltransferase family 4 protein [Kiritimatiellia bacterium]|nr:glycosyltransferase family 4 protein [Kiritimatiellia bacterium]HMP33435.1 glycosyltransferase family 4 protein [Kiritimatiellia bacterium]